MADSHPAHHVRAALPQGGLFADLHWRVAVGPLKVDAAVAADLLSAGRVLAQFYRAANLLYRRSHEGKAPGWVAEWLDQGKPASLIELQRDAAFRNEIPRVIRPDFLLTADGLAITELDSVPGGIGLTTWLYQTYEALAGAKTTDAPGLHGGGTVRPAPASAETANEASSGAAATEFLGSAERMRQGFAAIFGDAPKVHLMVSEESASYRPEMEWLASVLPDGRFQVKGTEFTGWQEGDAVYRFFELFDLEHIAAAPALFEAARERRIRLTPPPKPLFEEKLLFGLLWNRHLRSFWRQELGEGFLDRMQRWVPYTWVMDPSPLPPHAALPELNLTEWGQLKALSQRERDLILKVSGFSPEAWGARGVHLGSDLNATDWAVAVDRALASWPTSPYVLQRYRKTTLVDAPWYDFDHETVVGMTGRARLSPYYFVAGDPGTARPELGGVLATVCPADKKIIHGMIDATLAPCVGPVPPPRRNPAHHGTS